MMTAASSSSRENRKSSIESEPRALSLAELHEAREAAIYVLSTKTWEEAADIFTRGLKPVKIGILSYEGLGLDDDEEFMLYNTGVTGCRRHRRRSYNGCSFAKLFQTNASMSILASASDLKSFLIRTTNKTNMDWKCTEA